VDGVFTDVYVTRFSGNELPDYRNRILLYHNRGEFMNAATSVSLGYDPRSKHYILLVTQGAKRIEAFLSPDGKCWQHEGRVIMEDKDRTVSMGPPSIRCIESPFRGANCWIYYVTDVDPFMKTPLRYAQVKALELKIERESGTEFLFCGDYSVEYRKYRIFTDSLSFREVKSLIGSLGLPYYEPEYSYHYYKDPAWLPGVLVSYWGQSSKEHDYIPRVATVYNSEILLKGGERGRWRKYSDSLVTEYDVSVVYGWMLPSGFEYWMTTIFDPGTFSGVALPDWLPTYSDWFRPSPYDEDKPGGVLEGGCNFYSFSARDFPISFWGLLLIFFVFVALKKKK
jgi:hypothetical protein